MVQIQAVQSVMPTKQTDPIQSHKLTIPHNLSSSTFIQRHFNIVLCYHKSSGNDSGSVMAGWLKESLGRALSEDPLFAGRLRKSHENGGDWCIVTNDSGARLLEGSIDMNLADFLDLNGKKDVEAELVYWEDILEKEPQFSPLFYVQVTNFTCGGYSIGISCSLVLADPFSLTSFIEKWTNFHKTLLSSQTNEIPIFYLPKLWKPDTTTTLPLGEKKTKIVAQSLIFNIPTEIISFDENFDKNLAVLCIDEAERVAGQKLASKFSLFLKEPNEDLKVEICSREGIGERITRINTSGLACASMLDDLNVDKMSFDENQVAYGSCWINSMIDESCVMMILSDAVKTSEMKIVVTLT